MEGKKKDEERLRVRVREVRWRVRPVKQGDDGKREIFTRGMGPEGVDQGGDHNNAGQVFEVFEGYRSLVKEK